ncbi:MAG: hypothetical protein P1P69_06880 [Methanosarcinaceae archaeon]|nr:hypothetical protein [Methanosarcinaceae archaeon]
MIDIFNDDLRRDAVLLIVLNLHIPSAVCLIHGTSHGICDLIGIH